MENIGNERVVNNCSQINLPFAFKCSRPGFFSIWLTYHIAFLEGYNSNGFFEEKCHNNSNVSINDDYF